MIGSTMLCCCLITRENKQDLINLLSHRYPDTSIGDIRNFESEGSTRMKDYKHIIITHVPI